MDIDRNTLLALIPGGLKAVKMDTICRRYLAVRPTPADVDSWTAHAHVRSEVEGMVREGLVGEMWIGPRARMRGYTLNDDAYKAAAVAEAKRRVAQKQQDAAAEIVRDKAVRKLAAHGVVAKEGGYGLTITRDNLPALLHLLEQLP